MPSLYLRVAVQWIPAHCRLAGNEETARLANMHAYYICQVWLQIQAAEPPSLDSFTEARLANMHA